MQRHVRKIFPRCCAAATPHHSSIICSVRSRPRHIRELPLLSDGAARSFVHERERPRRSIQLHPSAHVDRSMSSGKSTSTEFFVFSSSIASMANIVGQIATRKRRRASGVRQAPYSTPSGRSCSFERSNHQTSIEGRIRAAILKAAGNLRTLIEIPGVDAAEAVPQAIGRSERALR